MTNSENENPTTGSVTISSIRPFHNVGDVLVPTFKLLFQNFWLITKIVVVIIAPFEILRTLKLEDLPNNGQLTVGLFLLDALCRVLIAPALIYALMQVMQTGIAPSVNESYRWGLSKLGKLIICAVLASVLQTLGFALCIIPGILVYLSLVLAYPIVILENGSATGALDSSHQATKGHRWEILGASIVLWLFVALFSLPEMVTEEFLTSGIRGLWLLHVAAAILSDIIEQSLTVLSLVIYLSIRALWSQSTQ